jgi:hypothetical protein
MKSLHATDSAALVDGPKGMIQWALDDTYVQAHGNKPEYAGRVLGVSKNILHGRGNSHSYYTPSQARAQNPGSSAAMSKMIERALEVEIEQHRVQMAREREEITAPVTDQVTTQVAQQVAKQMSAQMQVYEAKIRQLVEGSRVVTSELEVTNVMARAHAIYRSSIDSRSGNNMLLLFLIW